MYVLKLGYVPYFLPTSTVHIAADECLRSDQTLQLQTVYKSRVKPRAKKHSHFTRIKFKRIFSFLE